MNPFVGPKPNPVIHQKKPNLISGSVRSTDGGIITEAFVDIKDEGGKTVRSLKTNEVGGFVCSSSLPNGIYTIEIKFPNKNSLIKQIELNGGICPTIEFITQERGTCIPILFSAPKKSREKPQAS